MSDTLVATSEHYQKVRARLWGGPAKKRAAALRRKAEAKKVEVHPVVMELPPMRKFDRAMTAKLPTLKVKRPHVRDWLWVCTPSVRKSKVGIDPDTILSAVAGYFQVPVSQMVSYTRAPIAIRARFTAVHLLFHLTGMTGPGVGAAMLRDHTSISWARRRAAALCKTDPAFAGDVVALTNMLMGGQV